MKIQIKKMSSTATLPTRADSMAAGYDLYADIPEDDDEFVDIMPEETLIIGTGIACAIPEGYFGAVYARSGLSTRQGLRPANCVGVIDASYRGEIKVALHNDSGEARVIRQGDRIAQLVIQQFQPIEWEEVLELPESERNDGGFGSSGR